MFGIVEFGPNELEVGDIPGGEEQAHQHAGDGAGGVGPLPEDAREEAGNDGRSQVGEHLLEVRPDVRELDDLRCPHHRERHEDEGHDPPRDDEAVVRDLRLELLDEVHGDEGRRRVQRRVDRRHDRRYQRRDDEPADADRQQIEQLGARDVVHVEIGALL